LKILFIFPHINPYNSQSVREKPSGGTEKCVIFLSEAFTKLGHECRIITQMEEPFDPSWPDVVITQLAQFFDKFPEKTKKIWWVHHFGDQPVIKENALYARLYADRVVTLSHCQHDDFKRNLRIESTIIGHGVWLDEVHSPIEKDPYRLIYASAPFRGLDQIPKFFREIKTREPRATIAICSSHKMYGKPEDDEKYQALFKELAGMEGVELLGSLNQTDLYREYARASIFFYPCTWEETYCLAMDEAIAHGCTPFTTGLGALNERWEGFPLESLAQAVSVVIGHPNTNGPEHWFQPKDWLEIARQWEREVLNG
jgi:glycosyltransferase involved in cell wall biosynthesis